MLHFSLLRSAIGRAQTYRSVYCKWENKTKRSRKIALKTVRPVTFVLSNSENRRRIKGCPFSIIAIKELTDLIKIS